MDNMAYLEQIAASSRPKAPNGTDKTSLLSKLLTIRNLMILVGVIAAIIFLVIISSLFTNVGNKPKDTAIQSELRTTNLITTIDTYNKSLKSSTLRSLSNSLLSVLTNTSQDLSPILAEKYNFTKPETAPAKVLDEENRNFANLNNALEEAELSALLDRVYVREFILQIALLVSIESEAAARTEDTNLKTVLQTSINNLTPLQTEFENYQTTN